MNEYKPPSMSLSTNRPFSRDKKVTFSNDSNNTHFDTNTSSHAHSTFQSDPQSFTTKTRTNSIDIDDLFSSINDDDNTSETTTNSNVYGKTSLSSSPGRTSQDK